MSGHNLSNDVSALVVASASAAGTSLITSAAIDMANYEGALIMVKFGTIVTAAVTSIKVQGSDDDGSSDAYADLLGTGQTVADDDDDKVFVIDIFKPQERYLKALVVKATQNSTVESIIVLRYGAKKLPATDDSATVGGSEVHVSPAEGTA